MSNLKRVKASNYFHAYEDNETGFRFNVIMNPRDSMVFVEITSLPSSDADKTRVLAGLTKWLTDTYGGKLSIRVRSDLTIPEGVLLPGTTSANIRYLGKPALDTSISTLRQKEKVQAHLAKFTVGGEFKFLDKEDLLTLARELSDFKISQASFVSKEKILTGQYSERAEIDKLLNPHVRHFAIRNHLGNIIACVMLAVHGDLAYISELTTHADYRETGLAQALLAKTHEALAKTDPALSGVWIIAGGHGSLPVGDHLYGKIFPTESLNALQSTLGLLCHFGLPKKELLKASNRDLNPNPKTNAYDSLDSFEQYIDPALRVLTASTELRLGAAMPQAPKAAQTLATAAPSLFRKAEDTATSAAPPDTLFTGSLEQEFGVGFRTT